MNKKIIFFCLTIMIIGSYYFISMPNSSATSNYNMVVYKSPTCLCCNDWITHMEDNGFKVEAHNVDDVDIYKDEHSVPHDARSCHTALVNGYFIEGHVPADDVIRLLKEKKEVIGLAVPGMPVGSPGMEMGERKEPYDVVAYSKDGAKVYSSYR